MKERVTEDVARTPGRSLMPDTTVPAEVRGEACFTLLLPD
jgi:hypothetical protein